VNEYDSGSCGLEDEVLGSCGQLKTAVKAKTKKSLAASQALRRIREAKKVANKREARHRAASTRVRVVKVKTKKSLAASRALRRIREAKKVANKREARHRAASTRVRVCVSLCRCGS